MYRECELLAKCGFFSKYGQTKEAACQGFINQYCQGPKQDSCKRKAYRLQHGSPPPEDMLPTGQMYSK